MEGREEMRFSTRIMLYFTETVRAFDMWLHPRSVNLDIWMAKRMIMDLERVKREITDA